MSDAPAEGKRARTRAKLIETARAVAEEKGFVAASLDEIAARAGMTKGAIYSNFAGKADLMFEAAMAGSLTTEPVYKPGAPLKAQFRALAQAVLGLLPRARGRERLQADFQLYAAGEPEVARRMADYHVRFFDQLTAVLEQNYAGQLKIPARHVVMAGQALSSGFIHQHLITPDEISEQAVIDAFEALAEGASKG